MEIYINKYWTYFWVETHHPSLPFYIYHGVNINILLNLEHSLQYYLKCYQMIVDIYLIYAQ